MHGKVKSLKVFLNDQVTTFAANFPENDVD